VLRASFAGSIEQAASRLPHLTAMPHASQASFDTTNIWLFLRAALSPCHRSNHKSVLGIGGYARERGVTLSCVDEDGMEAWLSSSSSGDDDSGDGSQGTPLLQPPAAGSNITYSLVAYPPKDNLEGRLYDWSWVAKVCSAVITGSAIKTVMQAASHTLHV
jgi:hypothetical protein